ncbi:MAG: winged helix-turn-helix domain-containing protein [Candidatus Nanoarchaeia archaeon]
MRAKGGSIKPTHLLYKSNLSHQMMSDYLLDLIKKEFVQEEISGKKRKQKLYVLTDKGYLYLAEYKTVVQFVESFGLDDDE